MSNVITTADQILERVLAVLETRGDPLLEALDELPAAVYVTDAEGFVTYFNPACIEFSGRRPELGRDRWCVTWKLYTDAGEFLPHDQCPMAVAIKTGRTVRGVTAVAERPDGTRVNFRPYPTPLFGPDGGIIGAVNLLMDVTEEMQVEFLLDQARRCRRLAFGVDDRQAAETLEQMAVEYEDRATRLRLN